CLGGNEVNTVTEGLEWRMQYRRECLRVIGCGPRRTTPDLVTHRARVARHLRPTKVINAVDIARRDDANTRQRRGETAQVDRRRGGPGGETAEAVERPDAKLIHAGRQVVHVE